MATTRRQLIQICSAKGLSADILTPIHPPNVAHYLGRRILPQEPPIGLATADEDDVETRIVDTFERNNVGFAYGSLACGADILFAEAALACSAELHVVLPFEKEEFKRISVESGGANWGPRFERCLEAAASVTLATEDSYLGDDALFTYCSRLAMGLAAMRANELCIEPIQLALWDGQPSTRIAGTSIDIDTWRALGRHTEIIRPANALTETIEEPGHTPSSLAAAHSSRVVRIMLFGDFKQFSTLGDGDLPNFQNGVIRPIGQALERFNNKIQYKNTWGDAIFLVFTDAHAAVDCAIAIQDTVRSIDWASLGLPFAPMLRLGGHIGPIFEGHDFVRNEPTFFGAHVTRAARLEPVTPPGQVYVTEPVAAALALEGLPHYTCEYVGHLPYAKDYGPLRMYVVHWRKP